MPLTLQRIEILKLPSIENADKIVKSDDVLLSSDADSLKNNAFQHLYSRGAKRFGISFQNILRVPNCTVLLVHLYAYALLYFPCCCCVSKQKCCFVGVAHSLMSDGGDPRVNSLGFGALHMFCLMWTSLIYTGPERRDKNEPHKHLLLKNTENRTSSRTTYDIFLGSRSLLFRPQKFFINKKPVS